MALLDRGPIPTLQASLDSLQPEPPQFAQLASVMLAGAADLEVSVQTFSDAQAAADLPLDFYDASNWMDLAATNAVKWEAENPNATADNTDHDAGVIGDNLQFINREAPLEAWQPVPNPDFIPGTSGPFPDIPGPTTISMVNNSRPGFFPFQVGDSYTITVNVQSGQGAFEYQNVDEWLIRFLNGTEVPYIDIGNTDQFGTVKYTGSFTAADVGTWHIYPLPLGAQTSPALDFSVVAAPVIQPPPPPVVTRSVALLNVTRGTPSQFHVGDQFEIVARGAPGETVGVAGIHNGAGAPAPVQIGVIDQSGGVNIFGFIDSASIGSWIETYYVGGVRIVPDISFQVVFP
jgi:hypothetical protein